MSNPFLRAYEFEKRYKLERLRYMLEQAEEALKGYRPETIDWAKSALETICKAILDDRGVEYKSADGKFLELPKLIKKTCVTIGRCNEQLIGNITGLVQAIAEMRNKDTVAGHGLEGDRPLLSRTEISIFVSTFSNIVEIILCLMESSSVDLTNTKLPFDAVEAELDLVLFNEELDASISVKYGEDDGSIYVGGKEFRPSFLMYNYDRRSYLQALNAAKDRFMESIIENLKRVVADGVGFDLVRSGRNECEFLIKETTVSRASVRGGIATATGSVVASVDPDEGREYTKELFLFFSAEVDLSAGEESMKLRSLSLEAVG